MASVKPGLLPMMNAFVLPMPSLKVQPMHAATLNQALYGHYQSLTLKMHDHGILEIVMGAAQSDNKKLSTADHNMHRELSTIWQDIDKDPDTRVALIRGEGKGFSAGGDLSLVEAMANDFNVRARVWKEARELVYNVINCGKPIVSAMHGSAVGAGLVAGLLADISIASKTALIIDGHTRLGVAAGDHAAIVWPLLCGMAKAKYYLLLCEAVSGEEAERIGLVSLTVDEPDLLPKAFEVAERLAKGSPTAIRWTKYALNNWLRLAGPTLMHLWRWNLWAFQGLTCMRGLRRCVGDGSRSFERNSPI